MNSTRKTVGLPLSFEPAVDGRDMCRKVEELRLFFEAYAAEEVPGHGYDAKALSEFVSSVVRGQRGPHANIAAAGSWSVVGNSDPIPSDARVDFVFTPTYLVVAILALYRRRSPAAASAIPGFDEALRRGMHFATLRRLQGHGYDAGDEARRALTVLEAGEVSALLAEAPEFCPELAEIMGEARRLRT